MTIETSCKCGRTFRLKDDLLGKKIRCPECSSIVLVKATLKKKKAPAKTSKASAKPKSSSTARRPAKRNSQPAKARKKKKSGIKWQAPAIAAGILIGVTGVGYLIYSQFFTGGAAAGNSTVVGGETQPGIPVAAAPPMQIDDSDLTTIVLPEIIPSESGSVISISRSGNADQWRKVALLENAIRFEEMTANSYRAYGLQKDTAKSSAGGSVWNLLVSKPEIDTSGNNPGWLFEYLSITDRIVTAGGQEVAHPSAMLMKSFVDSAKSGTLSVASATTLLQQFVDARARVGAFNAIADDSSIGAVVATKVLSLIKNEDIARSLITFELTESSMAIPVDDEQCLQRFAKRADFNQSMADALIDATIVQAKVKRVEGNKHLVTRGWEAEGVNEPYELSYQLQSVFPQIIAKASPDSLVELAEMADGGHRSLFLQELKKSKRINPPLADRLLTPKTDSFDLEYLTGMVSVEKLIAHLKTSDFIASYATGDGTLSLDYASEFALNVYQLPKDKRDSVLRNLIKQYKLPTETIVKACVWADEENALRQHLRTLSPDALKAAEQLAKSETPR